MHSVAGDVIVLWVILRLPSNVFDMSSVVDVFIVWMYMYASTCVRLIYLVCDVLHNKPELLMLFDLFL